MMLCSSRAQPIRSLGSRNEQLSSRLAAHDRLVNPRRGIEDGKRSQSTTRAQEKSACSRDSGINDVTLKHLSSHVTCGPRTLRLRGHSTLDSRAYTATDADPDDVTRRGAASHDRIGYGYGARNFNDLNMYGVRPCSVHTFGDQLGGVPGTKSKIEDGSDLGTSLRQVTSVADFWKR